jgi:arginine decarboxylase
MAELEETAQVINAKNFREYYHDALLEREELQSLFELGYLSLEARARAEATFRDVARRALEFARAEGPLTGEFEALQRGFRRGYVANFSVFRSVPDAWSVKQLFPIVPIHRLNEDPEEMGILLDLTCDSDGKLDRFVHPKVVKEGLELHGTRPAEPYVLAICLLGAYQDVMGNRHNLLGSPDEVSVRVDPSGGVDLEALRGEGLAESIPRVTGWDHDEVQKSVSRRLRAAEEAGRLEPETRENLREELRNLGAGRSYLDGKSAL